VVVGYLLFVTSGSGHAGWTGSNRSFLPSRILITSTLDVDADTVRLVRWYSVGDKWAELGNTVYGLTEQRNPGKHQQRIGDWIG
jgi:hypothetical protein